MAAFSPNLFSFKIFIINFQKFYFRPYKKKSGSGKRRMSKVDEDEEDDGGITIKVKKKMRNKFPKVGFRSHLEGRWQKLEVAVT